MIGRTLSHYRIVGELGAGGMRTVFRAEDLRLGRPVALKFPHRELLPDTASRARFLREARIASVLDHPNIVVLYDVGKAEGEIFLAMQCIDGCSLRERLRAGSVPLAETLRVGRAVADALAYAHGRDVVHRDVKPENVLLSNDGRVKVADFGTARIATESQRTGTGTWVGSLGYWAPETVLGRVAEARSDLYSLGVVLHELCAGVPPFHGDHPAALLYRIAHEAPHALPPSADAPPELRRLILALMSKAPERRPASAIEVADTLLHIGGGPTAGRSADGPLALPVARSIAVIDFHNLTGDPEDDYFCAGITEDVVTDLLKIPDLQVASRGAVQSLGEKQIDAREAGRTLGVATVLEGSVRRAAGRVRVSAQLVRTDTGYHLWAERYDRNLEDIFEVQEDISRQIAHSLRLALEPVDQETRLGRRTRSPKAYDLRLQALAHYRRFEEADMRRAIALLEESIREDPAYALARADLGECCVQMFCKGWDLDQGWLERGEAEARGALELAASLPEGHRALGHAWNHRRNLERALRDLHRAVELDPRFTGALLNLGLNYLFLGDPSRAELYTRRALDTDPREPRAAVNLTLILLRQRRLPECREFARHALTLELSRAHRFTVMECLMLSHLWENNRAEIERLAAEVERELAPDAGARCLRALAAAFVGDAEGARRLLEQSPGSTGPGTAIWVSRARVLLLLGDRDAALAEIEHASRLDVVDVDELRTDPHFSTLRGDPRFEKVLASQS
ncbi:MAG TPA: protein kinase [Candidatus Eisenbacteria bacterium]|jgi:TolB-like protein